MKNKSFKEFCKNKRKNKSPANLKKRFCKL